MVAATWGGVAIHEGKLAQSSLRELEMLLTSGVMMVIVASEIEQELTGLRFASRRFTSSL